MQGMQKENVELHTASAAEKPVCVRSLSEASARAHWVENVAQKERIEKLT